MMVESLESRQLLSVAPVGVTAFPNPVFLHQPVILAATVPGDATGSVAFTNASGGNATLGSVALDNANAVDALHFLGGHVELGSQTLTSGATTISFWYQYDDFTDQLPMLLDLKVGPYGGAYIAINKSGTPGSGRQTISFNNRTGGGDGSWQTQPYTPTPWTHVELSFGGENGGNWLDALYGTNYSIYVNGQLQTNLVDVGADGGYTVQNRIGGDSFAQTYLGYNNSYLGSIAELLVYDTSSVDAAALYNGGDGVHGLAAYPDFTTDPSTNHLMAGYHFNDAPSGGTIADFSGNGNDGTLVGNVSLVKVVSLSTTDLPVGDNAITANYSGDDSYDGNTSAAATVTVHPVAALTATPTAISTASLSGQSVALTAVVPGDAIGSVQFKADGTNVGSSSAIDSGTTYALQLQGNGGYMQIPYAARPDGSGTGWLDMGGSDVTVAMSIRPAQAFNNEAIAFEHGVWQQSSGMYQLAMIGSQTARFNFPAMNANEGPLDVSVNLADGNWHFLVATFQSPANGLPGVARLYDNGQLLGAKFVAEAIAADDGPTDTWIGVRGGSSLFFRGGVGETLVYNRALSSSEIMSLYQNPNGTVATTGLAAGYRFGDSDLTTDPTTNATTVADLSGNGNTGQLSTSGTGRVPWVKTVSATVSTLSVGTHAITADYTTDPDNPCPYYDSTSAVALEIRQPPAFTMDALPEEWAVGTELNLVADHDSDGNFPASTAWSVSEVVDGTSQVVASGTGSYFAFTADRNGVYEVTRTETYAAGNTSSATSGVEFVQSNFSVSPDLIYVGASEADEADNGDDAQSGPNFAVAFKTLRTFKVMNGTLIVQIDSPPGSPLQVGQFEVDILFQPPNQLVIVTPPFGVINTLKPQTGNTGMNPGHYHSSQFFY